jgi:hypothetical protein
LFWNTLRKRCAFKYHDAGRTEPVRMRAITTGSKS